MFFPPFLIKSSFGQVSVGGLVSFMFSVSWRVAVRWDYVKSGGVASNVLPHVTT